MKPEGARAAVGALLNGDDNTPDRDHPCAICGKTTKLEGFIVNSVRVWNSHAATPDDVIRPSMIDVACPGECNAELYRRKHEAEAKINAQSDAYLAMMYAGNYNAESLAWLRSHGFRKQVERHLAKEGTSKAHA